MVYKVQGYSGLSMHESHEALENMVESLAVHLSEQERRLFANRLPARLRDMALSVYATERNSTQDIVEQFMEQQGIARERAIRQVQAAWRVLQGVVSKRQAKKIQNLLTNRKLALQ